MPLVLGTSHITSFNALSCHCVHCSEEQTAAQGGSRNPPGSSSWSLEPEFEPKDMANVSPRTHKGSAPAHRLPAHNSHQLLHVCGSRWNVVKIHGRCHTRLRADASISAIPCPPRLCLAFHCQLEITQTTVNLAVRDSSLARVPLKPRSGVVSRREAEAARGRPSSGRAPLVH